ncbi:MAG: hypothetical protein ABJH05_08975 [Fulvivirga sp.]
MSKRLIILSTLLLVGHFSFAQKIKYKDLYPLLSANRYEEAKPFLEEFLQDEKNREKDPNALFQMARIYQDEALESDVLLETSQFQTYADSAIFYFEESLKFIDEKEVKRNDEYYQAYKRRDIRTGKFGIKLGDVQFDIEEKTKALKERKTKVAALSKYFEATKSAYDSANSLYNSIKESFPTKKQLLLRLDEPTRNKLGMIEANYNHAVENFTNYKNTLDGISKTGYNQDLVVKPINDYNSEGGDGVDYTKDNVAFWNYAAWADEVKENYNDDVLPLFSELIAIDQTLKDLLTKVNRDSVSVIKDIPVIESNPSIIKLKGYDSNPMPVVLFKFKTAQLTYESKIMQNHSLKDSADVLLQMRLLNEEVNGLRAIDSLINLLLAFNIEEEALNYQPFVVSQYSNVDKLKNHIKNQLDHVIEVKKHKEMALEKIIDRSRWLIAKKDSIPLFMPESVGETKYLPVLLDSLVTAGIYLSGETPAQGYIAEVNNARNASMHAKFEINTDHFNKANYEYIQADALALIGDDLSIYFVIMYAQLPEQEEYTAMVVRANDEELLWSKNIVLASAPGKLAYNIQTDEIIINYEMAQMEGVGGQLVGNKLTLSKDGQIVDP